MIKSNIIVSNKISKMINSQYSFITNKINGSGYFRIFSDTHEYGISTHNFDKPNEVHINDINQTGAIKDIYYMNKTQNIIKLIWNDNIKSITATSFLFKNCYNISEIDLSNFNSTNVFWMEEMFFNCFSLISINFTNFNTYKISICHIYFLIAHL